MINKYPYTDAHQVDLSYILTRVEAFTEQVKNMQPRLKEGENVEIINNVISFKIPSRITSDIAKLFTNKQDKLVSGQTIKTINGQSILGSGNIQITGSGMEFYKVTYNGSKIYHDDVELTYTDLVDKYNSPDYFLYAEAYGLTFIPSLPPLEDDPIIEFICTWYIDNQLHVARLIMNSSNQIKYEMFDVPQTKDIKVNDVQINGTSIINNKVANIPVANRTGRAGVSYFPTWSGITVDANGQAYLEDATDVRIASRNTYNPITCYSLDMAVKAAMCDGKGAYWSAAEKTAAQSRIGIDSALIDTLSKKTYAVVTDLTLSDEMTIMSFDFSNKNYKKAIAVITLPANSGAQRNVALNVNFSGSPDYISVSKVITRQACGHASNVVTMISEIDTSNGLILADTRVVNGSLINSSSVYKSANIRTAEKINKIGFATYVSTGYLPFPVGTNFKIYAI